MRKLVLITALACIAGATFAQSLSEDFANVPGLFSSGGWLNINHSTSAGTNAWIQGVAAPNWFDGPAGVGDTTYAMANYTSTTGTGATGNTLSTWMLTPVMTFVNGSTISFQTKSAGGFADRLQVRIGTNGSDSNIGTLPEDVGTYTNLLLDINPTETPTGYTTTWTTQNITLSGLSGPTTTRLAFRYFVHDGGPNGNNSNGIGVDTLRVGAPVPEPASMAVLGLGALAMIRRRRSRKA